MKRRNLLVLGPPRVRRIRLFRSFRNFQARHWQAGVPSVLRWDRRVGAELGAYELERRCGGVLPAGPATWSGRQSAPVLSWRTSFALEAPHAL